MLVLPPSRMLSTNRSASLADCGRVALKLGLEGLDAVVVGDDVEQCRRRGGCSARTGGAFLACSIFLPAIEPERSSTKMTVLGRGLGSRCLDLGAGQQQEVAVFAGRSAGSSGRSRRVPLGQGVDELEVVVGRTSRRFQRPLTSWSPARVDSRVVDRAIERLDRVAALDPERQRSASGSASR